MTPLAVVRVVTEEGSAGLGRVHAKLVGSTRPWLEPKERCIARARNHYESSERIAFAAPRACHATFRISSVN